ATRGVRIFHDVMLQALHFAPPDYHYYGRPPVASWRLDDPGAFRPGPGRAIADYLGGKGNSPATSRRPGDRSPRRRWDPRTVGHADRFKCERRGEVKTTQMQPSDLQYLPITRCTSRRSSGCSSSSCC